MEHYQEYDLIGTGNLEAISLRFYITTDNQPEITPNSYVICFKSYYLIESDLNEIQTYTNSLKHAILFSDYESALTHKEKYSRVFKDEINIKQLSDLS